MRSLWLRTPPLRLVSLKCSVPGDPEDAERENKRYRMLSAETRDDLLRRLSKIEGQTRGIQRMIAEGRDCQQVLNQLASVRAATRRASIELIKAYVMERLSDPTCLQNEEALQEIVSFLLHI